ncbi:hypothetical protein BGX26_006650 [Mortierella sp. AD094]|nr:hypothetical protein BGX26_006650 [Mortierella sp. AD094]
MQGLAASKWARKPATPSDPLCPSLSHVAASNTTSQPLLVPLSNSPAFTSVLMSVPIQSPLLTQQPAPAAHQQFCEPLFVLPKKTAVRISASSPTTSSASVAVSASIVSSAITSSPPRFTQSELPAASTLPLPLESASGSSAVFPTRTEERISSADVFFGEDSFTTPGEPEEIFEGESKAKRDSEGLDQLSGPNQPATSLSELNPSLSDIEKLPPISEQTSMANSSTGSRGSAGGSGAFVNPYIAYVAEIDPDGTMDDGRSYVGGARHYVDKPPTKSNPPASYSAARPANSNKTAPPSSRPSTNTAQNQASYKQQPGSSAGSSSKQRSSRSDRGITESRWSGRPLATADMLPEDFFGTAKAVSTPAATSSQRNPSRYEDSPRTESWQTPKTASTAWNEPQPTKFTPVQQSHNYQSGVSRTQPEPRTPSQPHEYQTGVSRTQPEPRTLSQPHEYQLGVSRTQYEPISMIRQEESSTDLYEVKQALDTIPLNSPGHEKEYIRTQTSMSRSQPMYQSFESSRRGSMRNNGAPSQGYTYESDTESSSTYRSHVTSSSRDGFHKPAMSNIEPRYEQTPPQNQGNPLFLQYPIGDGCHVVVAIYVEKDAQSALKRFPNIERTRQESSRRDKTLDEMAVIFKEVLEDEKKNLTG